MTDYYIYLLAFIFLLGILSLIIVPAIVLWLYILKRQNKRLRRMIDYLTIDSEYDIKNNNGLSEIKSNKIKDETDKEESDH
jgi:hypothetical protein